MLGDATYFDVLASGAESGDSISLTVTYTGSRIFPDLWLFYYNSTDGFYEEVTPVQVSGNTFTVTLDKYSTPTIFALNGTVFAVAPAPFTASPAKLWPPNHKMVPVTVNAPSGWFIVSVSSNEPETGLGSGDQAPDSQITGPLTVNLRADRDAKGTGRIYTILLQNGSGAQNVAVVRVPRDMSH
jgi:hypothetical protein